MAAGAVQGCDLRDADRGYNRAAEAASYRRILARLIEEHGAQELSYSTVRDYVRVRRAQIDLEAGRHVEVFVPQEHAPGAEAEVDFREIYVVLNGLPWCSGKAGSAMRKTAGCYSVRTTASIPFDPGLVLNPRVDRSSMVTVRMVKYSVPARLIGRRVVSLRASELAVFDGRTMAARHQRVPARSGPGPGHRA